MLSSRCAASSLHLWRISLRSAREITHLATLAYIAYLSTQPVCNNARASSLAHRNKRKIINVIIPINQSGTVAGDRQRTSKLKHHARNLKRQHRNAITQRHALCGRALI